MVEDDDDVRIYTVDSLRELGYRVLEAHDGPSALRLLERRQEEHPRLLLTDVVMPGMSGRELADLARTRWPDMRVLFTTGYARNAIDHAGRLDAGVELLPKPFTYEALAAKVREVLEKGSGDRALIVDAIEEARALTETSLAALGFVSEPAATLAEALGKIRASGGMFDVVLLSEHMPGAKFDAFIEQLHAVRRDLPILVLSADNAAELGKRYAGNPCVRVTDATPNEGELQRQLAMLRVECARTP